MYNKIYEKIKKILKENLFVICTIVFTIIMIMPVPYYITTGGGIIDLTSRFKIDNRSGESGSYNLSYVSQIDGRVLTYLASYVIPSWERDKVDDYKISKSETMDDIKRRDILALNKANENATLLAYKEAGKDIIIKKQRLYIIYIDDEIIASKKLEVGDVILKIDNEEIESFDEFKNIVDSKEVNDKLFVTILSDGKEEDVTITVREKDGVKIAGLSFYEFKDFDVDPEITFMYKSDEQGPSAGFMMALAIYDRLLDEDLTHGLKIAGSGTISENGNVGEIGGVDYKLKGAVSDNADIFFAREGNNYEDCMKLKEKNGYDIEIVPVKTFYDAVNYLRSI